MPSGDWWWGDQVTLVFWKLLCPSSSDLCCGHGKITGLVPDSASHAEVTTGRKLEGHQLVYHMSCVFFSYVTLFISLFLGGGEVSMGFPKYLNRLLSYWANEMAQQVKALVSKTNDLSSVLGTHMTKGRNWLSELVTSPPCVYWVRRVSTKNTCNKVSIGLGVYLRDKMWCSMCEASGSNP